MECSPFGMSKRYLSNGTFGLLWGELTWNFCTFYLISDDSHIWIWQIKFGGWLPNTFSGIISNWVVEPAWFSIKVSELFEFHTLMSISIEITTEQILSLTKISIKTPLELTECEDRWNSKEFHSACGLDLPIHDGIHSVVWIVVSRDKLFRILRYVKYPITSALHAWNQLLTYKWNCALNLLHDYPWKRELLYLYLVSWDEYSFHLSFLSNNKSSLSLEQKEFYFVYFDCRGEFHEMLFSLFFVTAIVVEGQSW